MKKITLLLITSLFWQINFAQLSIGNQANGVVEVNYGASGDYSLYDPLGDSQVYLYLWINQDQTSPNLANVYNDDWNDSAGLVTLTYDNNLQKFTGTVDFNTHDFSGEGVLPAGTQINDFNLILRNQAGDRQSADLLASNYGFQPTTGFTEIEASKLMYVNQGQLFLKNEVLQNDSQIFIYDMNSKLLANFKPVTNIIAVNQYSSPILFIKVVLDPQKFAVLKTIK